MHCCMRMSNSSGGINSGTQAKYHIGNSKFFLKPGYLYECLQTWTRTAVQQLKPIISHYPILASDWYNIRSNAYRQQVHKRIQLIKRNAVLHTETLQEF